MIKPPQENQMFLSDNQFDLVVETLDTPIKVTEKGPDFTVITGGVIFNINCENKVMNLLLSLAYYLWSSQQSEDFVTSRLANLIYDALEKRFGSDFGYTTRISQVADLCVKAYSSDKYNLRDLAVNKSSVIDGITLGIDSRLLPLENPESYIEYVIEYLKENQDAPDYGYSWEGEEGEETGDSPIDSDVSELLKELQKEESEKIESQMKEITGSGTLPSDGISSEKLPVIETEPSENLARFLSALIDRRKKFKSDPLKHYNRNSRGTRDLMYSSISKKVKTGQVKLGILLDVSGSIPVETVSLAVSTIKSLVPLLDRNSVVLMWNTSMVGTVDLYSLDEVKAGSGGTDLWGGVRWLRDNNYKCIVVYSDFMTQNFNDFMYEVKLCKDKGIQVHFYPTEDIPFGYNPDDLEYFGLWKSVSDKGKGLTPSI